MQVSADVLSGAWVAAAVFVVTLLVGGLTWFLAGGGPPPPAAESPILLDSFSWGDVVYEFRAYPNSQGPEAPCVGLEYDLETGSRRATMACPTEASEELEYASHVQASPWTLVGYGLEADETIAVDDAIRVIITEEIDERRFFLIQFGRPVSESFQVPVTRPDGTTRFIAVAWPDDLPPSTTTSNGDPATLSANTLDLLDGSRLEFVGPSEMELTGYLFTIDVPGIQSSNVELARGVDPADPAAVDEVAVLEANLGNGIRLLLADSAAWQATMELLEDYSPEFFTTYMSDPSTENQIHLGVDQCVRELIPGATVVEDATHGEVIRGDGYASWCDQDADVEVMVHGDEQFVERAVSGVTLNRDQAAHP